MWEKNAGIVSECIDMTGNELYVIFIIDRFVCEDIKKLSATAELPKFLRKIFMSCSGNVNGVLR